MKKIIISVILLITIGGFAQNVGINSTGATPNSSALLDIDASPANNVGLLIPRIPLLAINNPAPVTSPALSLMIYNTATAGSGTTAVTPGYYYWDGAKWMRLQNTSSTAQDWNLLGNTGTSAGTNFLGTTDAQDLVIKTNNTENARVKVNGNIGIATPNPNTTLDVNGSFAYREGPALTLANGANNNIAISNFSNFRITGPSASYTISGIAGGSDGRLISLYNTTTQPITITNNSISTASNQILTLTGADITTPAGPNVILLQYNATVARWLIVGGQNLNTNSSSSNTNSLIYTVDGF